jgi:hypothetical protein
VTGETIPRRTRRLAATFGWAALAIGLVLGGLYLALPALVAAAAPSLAARFGLSTLQLNIGYPQLRGVKIFTLDLAGEGFSVHGENAELGYTWRDLFKGQLNSLAFETLAVSVSAPGADSTEPQAMATPSFIPASPLRQLSAEQLLLELPDIGFLGRGGAVLSEGVLSLSLKGLQPEQASRFTMTAAFSYDGVFNASFGERGSSAKEFLTVQGSINDTVLNLQGEIDLADYALAVASALASVPQGEGTVAGKFQAQLPWPLPDTISSDDLIVTLPTINIDWRDTSLSLDNLQGSMAFDGSELLANLGGRVTSEIDSTHVEITLPSRYPITYQAGTDTLTGGAGLHGSVVNADTRILTTVKSFSITHLSAPQLAFDTEITASYDEFNVAGQLLGNANFTTGATTPTGDLNFVGVLSTPTQTRPAKIQADYQLTVNKLASAGILTSGIIAEAPFEFEYNLNSTAGYFNMAGNINFRQPLVATIFPEWIAPYDLDSGRAEWSLRLDWATPADIVGQFVSSLSDASGHYDDYHGSGISGQFEFQAADATDTTAWRLAPTTLTAQRVDIGMPIENLVVEFAWSGNEIPVTAATASLLGGKASATAFVYDQDKGSAVFDLLVDKVSIAEVLALEGDDVAATGTLSGKLPVSIAGNQASITDGRLSAAAPGGFIRASSALASLSGQPGLDFALAALQDFNYSELTTIINYSPNGDLALGIGLKGHNPAVEGGRPIHYNLNISENVPVLLESLRVQDQVTERVEKQVLR